MLAVDHGAVDENWAKFFPISIYPFIDLFWGLGCRSWNNARDYDLFQTLPHDILRPQYNKVQPTGRLNGVLPPRQLFTFSKVHLPWGRTIAWSSKKHPLPFWTICNTCTNQHWRKQNWIKLQYKSCLIHSTHVLCILQAAALFASRQVATAAHLTLFILHVFFLPCFLSGTFSLSYFLSLHVDDFWRPAQSA